MKRKFKKLALDALTLVNKSLPKWDRVIIKGFPNTESSAVSVANYIRQHYRKKVLYVIDHTLKDDPRPLLLPGIEIVSKVSANPDSLANKLFQSRYTFHYMRKILTTKYLFFTHEEFFINYSKRQTMVNIWHGLLYKNICLLDGERAVYSDHTVATSDLSKKMFTAAFGVPDDSIIISGYPRNDFLLKAKQDKTNIKTRISPDLSAFDKIIMWLPTFRKSVIAPIRLDGIEVDNPFYIKDFDVDHFNSVLKESNTLCLVKPHPMAPKYPQDREFSNIRFIDDPWIAEQGITLYELVGCTDMLISDVSSIIIDYMLLDKPVICVSTDFDEYKENRGFYFHDIEEWIPSEVLKNQQDFFSYLQNLLRTGHDPYAERRLQLKARFFKDHDDLSTERLVTRVLGPAHR